MPRRCDLLLVASFAAGVAAGCVENNPQRCEQDNQCRDPGQPLCHPTKHYCYQGCGVDAECQDPAGRAFDPGKPRCDVATRRCVAAPLVADGGAGDGGRADTGHAERGMGDAGSKPAGAPCGGAQECASGACADSVCCDGTCAGGCVACNLAGSVGKCTPVPAGQDSKKSCGGKSAACAGACDGKGQCTFAATKGATCGPATCAAGEVSTSSCDDSGSCTTTKQGCGGFACEAAGPKCKTSCGGVGDCTAAAQCVGSTCVANLGPGETCGTNNDACANKQCVDGVCCKATSCGACKKCGAGGECLPLANGIACGAAPTCSGSAASGATKTVNSCQVGACTPQPQSCGLFLCDGTADCLKVCTADSHCKAGSFCQGAACVPKKALGESCTGSATGNNQCASGLCVDGVCCDGACAGSCEACNVASKAGSCSPIPAGTDPASECVGTAAPTCAGTCDGNRKCTWAAVAGKPCKTASCKAAMLSTFGCTTAGSCGETKSTCGDYQCNAAGAACLSSCQAHNQCTTGLCDLFGFPHGAAKKNTCVATPEQCTVGTATGAFQTCLDSLRPYVVVPSGTYPEMLATKAAVQIVAPGTTSPVAPTWPAPVAAPAAKLRPLDVSQYGLAINHPTLVFGLEIFRQTGAGDSLIFVGAPSEIRSCLIRNAGASATAVDAVTGSLLLKDVAIQDVNKNGVVINGALTLEQVSITGTSAVALKLNGGWLLASDLFVAFNWGVGIQASGGVVNIDRAFVGANVAGPGMSLDSIAAGKIWNTLVNNNGQQGVKLVGTAPTFYNVTVVDNGGVEVDCGGAAEFYNSIVWDKNNSQSYTGPCSFAWSDVKGGASGTGNIDADPAFTAGSGLTVYDLLPSSPCVNKGAPSLPGVTYPGQDVLGRPRVLGAAIDMGAYEAK